MQKRKNTNKYYKVRIGGDIDFITKEELEKLQEDEVNVKVLRKATYEECKSLKNG